jgi:hypothetical protein
VIIIAKAQEKASRNTRKSVNKQIANNYTLSKQEAAADIEEESHWTFLMWTVEAAGLYESSSLSSWDIFSSAYNIYFQHAVVLAIESTNEGISYIKLQLGIASISGCYAFLIDQREFGLSSECAVHVLFCTFWLTELLIYNQVIVPEEKLFLLFLFPDEICL